MGLDQTPVEERGPDATLPLITGAYGGHTIDFREFICRGSRFLADCSRGGVGGSEPFTVRRGERIAQLVVARVEHVRVEAVTALGGTTRGQGGFGSTG